MSTIGLSMILKDEPIDRLAGLVEFLKPVVDEFAFIDTGSQDFEVDAPLWRSWGVNVGQFEWCDNFSSARNATLPLLTTDWVLHLDADERPTMAMMEHLKWVKTEMHDQRTRGFLYLTINFWAGERGITVPEHWHTRLFKREGGQWYRPLHELVMIQGKEEHRTRDTVILPKAPEDAYIIHSKPREKVAFSDALYERMSKT